MLSKSYMPFDELGLGLSRQNAKFACNHLSSGVIVCLHMNMIRCCHLWLHYVKMPIVLLQFLSLRVQLAVAPDMFA